MKFLLFAFLLLNGNVLLAQSSNDTELTEFASEHRLINRKLKKLELIRNGLGSAEAAQSLDWKAAYAKWDKKGVTPNLNLDRFFTHQSIKYYLEEDFLPNYKYTGNRGLPLAYLFELTDNLSKEGSISDDEGVLLKNILTAQIDNSARIEKEISIIHSSFSRDLEKSEMSEIEINKLGQFITELSGQDNLRMVASTVSEFQEEKYSQLKKYLKDIGVSYNDLHYCFYKDEWRGRQKFTYLFEPLNHPNNKLITQVTRDFVLQTSSRSSLLRLTELDLRKYSAILENKTISNVILVKHFFDSWAVFEHDKFINSQTSQYLKRQGFYGDVDELLKRVRNNFPSYFAGLKFNIPNKEPLEQLLITAYNDVYFSLSLAMDDSKQVDVLSFDLTEEQRNIVKALLDTNARTTQIGLKRALMNKSFVDFEMEYSFQLACYIAFDQKRFKLNRDWNRSKFFTNPFDSNKESETIDIPSMDESQFAEFKRKINETIEQVDFEGHEYQYISFSNAFLELRPLPRSSIQAMVFQEVALNIPGEDMDQFVRFVTRTSKVSSAQRKRIAEENKPRLKPMELHSVEDARMVSLPPPPPPPPSPPSRPVPIRKGEIVDFPDVEASFPGGGKAMKKWIFENMQYPEISRELGDQGRVYVTFTVEIDGKITNVDVMRGGISPELNREAKRLVRNMPKWTPGEVKGKPCRARCRVPIPFILN